MKKGKKIESAKLPDEAFERVEIECPYCGAANKSFACVNRIVCTECSKMFTTEPDFDLERAKTLDDPRVTRPI